MKILSKIKRRADGDELPKRGHLVEMDLFDTDRNPLEISQGGDGRTTYIDLSPGIVVPFDPVVGDSGWASPLKQVNFTLENPCYAVLYGGAKFDVSSGAGFYKALTVEAKVEFADDVDDNIILWLDAEGTFVTNAAGYSTHASSSPVFMNTVLNPASYKFGMWCFKWDSTDDMFEATVRQIGVSLVLFPTNGDAGLSFNEFGGTGG